MTHTTIRILSAAAFALIQHATAAAAQATMTVSGHVTGRGRALIGAHVRIPDLRIDRVTDAEGRYSFLIPSGSVRGQTVRITASTDERRARFAPKTVSIALAGGAVIQDFDLLPVGDVAAAQPDETQPGVPGSRRDRGADADTLNLTEIAGAVSFPSELAGRVPGLDVVTSSTLGGSVSLTYRGQRSLVGSSQPLFVVDGIPMENTTFTSGAQRYGLGGFDYGSPVQDLDPSNIESVRFIKGTDATARYGGRAANGVIAVTTKRGTTDGLFAVSASQQLTSESVGTLPAFQNAYGQGLNGKFEFFNGKGGGVNDNVDQSWGPALDGRPVAQASYTEPGRPDVRLWTAQPDNVSNFFRGGKTLNTTLGIQGGGDLGTYRIFGTNRDTRGLTFGNSLIRREAGVALTVRPDPRFTLAVTTTIAETKNGNAQGTGYNEGNSYSQFLRMGRQVNTDSLREHLRSSTGTQISWNYAGQNNPYFAAFVNSSRSLRDHGFGAATATFQVTPNVVLTARGGADYWRDGRLFTIAPGWMGGYPFLTGTGDFSKGGSQGDYISVEQSNFEVRIDDSRTLSNGVRWTIGGGVDLQRGTDRTRSAGVDSIANVPSAGAPDGATVPPAVSWTADSHLSGVFGETSFAFGNSGTVKAVLRNEWSSIATGQSATTLYPAVSARYDLRQGWSALHDISTLSGAILRADISRTGGTPTPYAVATMYTGRIPSGTVTPLATSLLTPSTDLKPEVTTTAEVGVDLSFAARQLTLGFTAYNSRTSDVILPVNVAAVNSLRATNAGEISNSGIEALASLRVGDSERGIGWELSGNIARNSNNVEHLNDTVTAMALGPSLFGASIEARKGAPLGVIVGHRYLRDAATGALILSAGLPVPDLEAGNIRLGVAAPTWVVGMQSAVRYRWFSIEATTDGHMGGRVFSSTKLWGDFAGNLAETAFRPDSGLLIQGIDAVTKRANTQHVSTQDYYHALAAIQEPWVYSASYFKLRDARIVVHIPTNVWHFPFESASIALIGRNLHTWSSVHDFDPEVLLSPYGFSGMELGQYPMTKSVGLQFSVTP